MTACTWPRSRSSETPCRISRPSTATCRSLISNSANFLPLSGDVVGAAAVAGSEPARTGHGGAQQAPVGGLLLAAGVPAPRRHVLDGAVAVPQLEAALRPLHQLAHVALLRRQARQLADALLEAQARQPGPVPRLHTPGAGREEPLQLVLVHELHQLTREGAVAAREVLVRGSRQPVDVARPPRPLVLAGRDLDEAPGPERVQVTERALLADPQVPRDIGQAGGAPGLQQREDVLLAIHGRSRLYAFINTDVYKRRATVRTARAVERIPCPGSVARSRSSAAPVPRPLRAGVETASGPGRPGRRALGWRARPHRPCLGGRGGQAGLAPRAGRGLGRGR